MDLMQLLFSGAGGAILGPIVSQFLGGKNSPLLTRILAGIVGGAGVGAAADAAGLGGILPTIMNDPQITAAVQSVLEGAIGGAILSTLIGAVLRKK
jgi:hypothetical protein